MKNQMMLKNNVFSLMSFGFFALFVKQLDKVKNGGGKLGLYLPFRSKPVI